jgi:ribosomal protein S1
MDISDIFERHFPGHLSAMQSDAWEAAKARLPVGTSVSGVVVARPGFGVFLDIGVGFPALMLVPDIKGLTPEKYRAGDWCPIGSKVDGEVIGVVESRRQVCIAQGVLREA